MQWLTLESIHLPKSSGSIIAVGRFGVPVEMALEQAFPDLCDGILRSNIVRTLFRCSVYSGFIEAQDFPRNT